MGSFVVSLMRIEHKRNTHVGTRYPIGLAIYKVIGYFRIAHNLGILLINSNCFAIFFSSILVMSVEISICGILRH